MKTDRLLSIVIYLLNHDVVSAATLAERFEVSKRTILRDIEHISLAGIPIQSTLGANGGYSIMEGYKLDGRIISNEVTATVITALQGLLSAYGNKRYNEALEKISTAFPQKQIQNIFLDFGASGENEEIQTKLKTIETAINSKFSIEISYENALGSSSCRLIEPVALNYRWYAWYLLAFCTSKQDYRIFKVARIGEIKPTKMSFSIVHDENLHQLLEKTFQGGERKGIDITILCKAEIKISICEYLGGRITETQESGDFIMQVHVLEDERMWFATLLSFGDKLEVLQPKSLKMRLIETAKNILSLYQQ